jgi:hypothetical protein
MPCENAAFLCAARESGPARLKNAFHVAYL